MSRPFDSGPLLLSWPGLLAVALIASLLPFLLALCKVSVIILDIIFDICIILYCVIPFYPAPMSMLDSSRSRGFVSGSPGGFSGLHASPNLLPVTSNRYPGVMHDISNCVRVDTRSNQDHSLLPPKRFRRNPVPPTPLPLRLAALLPPPPAPRILLAIASRLFVGFLPIVPSGPGHRSPTKRICFPKLRPPEFEASIVVLNWTIVCPRGAK